MEQHHTVQVRVIQSQNKTCLSSFINSLVVTKLYDFFFFSAEDKDNLKNVSNQTIL